MKHKTVASLPPTSRMNLICVNCIKTIQTKSLHLNKSRVVFLCELLPTITHRGQSQRVLRDRERLDKDGAELGLQHHHQTPAWSEKGASPHALCVFSISAENLPQGKKLLLSVYKNIVRRHVKRKKMDLFFAFSVKTRVWCEGEAELRNHLCCFSESCIRVNGPLISAENKTFIS